MTMPTQTPAPEPSPGIALILGLTGAIGGGIARALAQRGWSIRALTRRPAGNRPAFPFPVEWRHGDALDAASVRAAAEGTSLIVHGVNPPGYARWREDGLPMLDHAIAAAALANATLLFPANVYVYSTAAPAIVSETTPRNPTTRKGRVRLEMEERLELATREDGIRVIAIRAGDFFGPGATNSWFSQAFAKGGLAARALQPLTPAGIGHSWAYLPDLAESFARLVDIRHDLPRFTLLHFAGHEDKTGRAMVEAARHAIGKPDLPIRPFRWIWLWLGAPFSTFLREALEMRWLWQRGLALDNAALRRWLGEEPHTPLEQAVRAALAGKT
jgi:nucleoside-diphosphate-sugar epimerase